MVVILPHAIRKYNPKLVFQNTKIHFIYPECCAVELPVQLFYVITFLLPK